MTSASSADFFRLFQRYFIACDVTDVIPDISNSAHTIYFLYEGDVSRCAQHADCGYRENYATAFFYITTPQYNNYSTIAHTADKQRNIPLFTSDLVTDHKRVYFMRSWNNFKIRTSANSRIRD